MASNSKSANNRHLVLKISVFSGILFYDPELSSTSSKRCRIRYIHYLSALQLGLPMATCYRGVQLTGVSAIHGCQPFRRVNLTGVSTEECLTGVPALQGSLPYMAWVSALQGCRQRGVHKQAFLII